MALLGKSMSDQQCQLLCQAGKETGAWIVLLGDASTEKDDAATSLSQLYGGSTMKMKVQNKPSRAAVKHKNNNTHPVPEHKLEKGGMLTMSGRNNRVEKEEISITSGSQLYVSIHIAFIQAVIAVAAWLSKDPNLLSDYCMEGADDRLARCYNSCLPDGEYNDRKGTLYLKGAASAAIYEIINGVSFAFSSKGLIKGMIHFASFRYEEYLQWHRAFKPSSLYMAEIHHTVRRGFVPTTDVSRYIHFKVGEIYDAFAGSLRRNLLKAGVKDEDGDPIWIARDEEPAVNGIYIRVPLEHLQKVIPVITPSLTSAKISVFGEEINLHSKCSIAKVYAMPRESQRDNASF